MKIGQLATRTRVNTPTLRYYERLGLIRSERCQNGYRDFDDGMVRLVGLVRMGQKLGFSLREMRDIVATISDAGMSAEQTADLLRDKLSDLDVRIGEMMRMKELLLSALTEVCPIRH